MNKLLSIHRASIYSCESSRFIVSYKRIPIIFRSCYETYIAGFVVSVIVNAVNGQTARIGFQFLGNIAKEILKAGKLDFDTSAPVIFVSLIFGIIASIKHIIPNSSKVSVKRTAIFFIISQKFDMMFTVPLFYISRIFRTMFLAILFRISRKLRKMFLLIFFVIFQIFCTMFTAIFFGGFQTAFFTRTAIAILGRIPLVKFRSGFNTIAFATSFVYYLFSHSCFLSKRVWLGPSARTNLACGPFILVPAIDTSRRKFP